jgi:hypothetical protein
MGFSIGFFYGVFPCFSIRLMFCEILWVAWTRASLSASMCLLILKGLPVPLEDVGHSTAVVLVDTGEKKHGETHKWGWVRT